MATVMLFVYGTLKRGADHHHLLDGASFLGEARTEAGWELIDLGAYPGLVPGEGVVEGELFAVDEQRRDELDAYEGHPDLFRRTNLRLDDGRTVVSYRFVDEDAVHERLRVPEGRWPP